MAKEHAVTVWEAENNDAPFRFGRHVAVSAWARLWTLGDRTILGRQLLALFCSSQCPGEIILRTYDLARSLRDARVPVISGFHSPMEKECLDLLLRGTQPVVVCPARNIERIRLPVSWKKGIQQGRLLVLSPFSPQHRRPTVALAEKRNHFVAEIAKTTFVAHAAPKGRTHAFCCQLLAEGRRVWTFDAVALHGIRRFASVQAVIDALCGQCHAG